MAEELDSPTLQISPGESSFSVWLDDQLLYTDCAELDNRIGHIRLPMTGWYRSDPIIITLPTDYRDKTLTIAQASPEYMETSYLKAWPASIQLYCGYAYESGLISETYRMAIAAFQSFLMTALMLVVFVRNRDWSALWLALAGMLWISKPLMGASFFYKYFGSYDSSLGGLIPLLSILVLLLFLTMRGGTHRMIPAVLTGLFALTLAGYAAVVLLTPYGSVGNWVNILLVDVVPYWLALISLMTILILTAVYWRKETWFFRIFAPLVFAIIAISLFISACFTYRGVLLQQLALSLSSGQAHFICTLIEPAIAAATLLTAIADAVKTELERRKERQWIEQHQEMAMASYENLRRQHEEVMMLRHDMMRHFVALRELDNTPQAAAYLEKLIGDNEKIQPVIQSGNKMLDLILNSKIASAAAKGIKVEIIRAEIADQLPLTDSELCSLIMNLLDNAINAASGVKVSPQIDLDMHVKRSFFIFTCTNSVDPAAQEAPGSRHGLGLKIVQRIAENYDCLIQTTPSDRKYSVTVAIPLSDQ